ncbi:MAG: twin-arginine translocase TatA/TatE family subunit [Myxococcota bacterium]
MFGLSFWEIAIIMAIALILLGPSKLPDLAKAFGKSLREFRKATEDFKSQIQEEAYREPPQQQLPRTVPVTDAVIEPPRAAPVAAAPVAPAAAAPAPVAAAPIPQPAAGVEPAAPVAPAAPAGEVKS